mgnify:CR=1 FL=1
MNCLLLLLEKSQEIVNLFGVVLDGAGGQLTALTMESVLKRSRFLWADRHTHPSCHRGGVGPGRYRYAELLFRIYGAEQPRQADELRVHRHDCGQTGAGAGQESGHVKALGRKGLLVFSFGRSMQQIDDSWIDSAFSKQ